MKNVTVVEHPLVRAAVTVLRDQESSPAVFRQALTTVSRALIYEALRDVPVRRVQVQTPLARATGARLARGVVVVPILRAGLGMLDAARELLPEARVGFVGARRDEKTLLPNVYLDRLPAELKHVDVLVLDPMLATGGSVLSVVELLQGRGARRIRLVHAIASPEGVRAVSRRHPEICIWIAAVDRFLDKRGYIVPGLGDAGDRLCGC